MNFTHYDLGNLEKGRIVEITLQGSAQTYSYSIAPIFQTIKMARIIGILEV